MSTSTSPLAAGRKQRMAALGAALVVTLVVTLLGAAPAAAAGSERALDPERTVAEVQEEALALARRGRVVQGADLLVRATDELRASDAEAAAMLTLAARLYHHASRLEQSYRTFRDASVRAFQAGRSARAAHLLLDAATVAMDRGRRAEAQEAADLAGYVLRVSRLTPRERTAVLSRVEYPAG